MQGAFYNFGSSGFYLYNYTILHYNSVVLHHIKLHLQSFMFILCLLQVIGGLHKQKIFVD